MFLLYPNYRGMMFSDQSQVASVDLTVTPPAGTSLSSLQVVLNATDSGGNIVASQTIIPTSTDFTASIDLSALPLGTYQLAGTIEDSGGNVLMTQSAYAIVKLDASLRAGMKAWIDPANRAHFLDGNPHFVLGIYDTTQYSLREAYYVPELAAIALAPINMIINYYITNAPTTAITAYTDAMQQFGMVFLPDVAAFYSGLPAWPTGSRQGVRHRGSGYADLRLHGGLVVRFQHRRLLHRRRARAHPPAADVPSVRAHQGWRSVGLHPVGVQHAA